jgi:hypothetical protein
MNEYFTCLIGIKLIDGVMEFSNSRCRELFTADCINECELDGTFELESAECGDAGEQPFDGRTIAWMSSPDDMEFEEWASL